MEQPKTIYSGKLYLADEDGEYLGLSRKYDVRITEDSLFLSADRIPLVKVVRAKRLGSGLELDYVDNDGLLTKIQLTARSLFGIGRKKRITAFLKAIRFSVTLVRTLASPEVLVAAQKTLPQDTCHDCRASGGEPAEFGTLYSFFVLTVSSTKKGVYCKEHVTRRGVSALLKTGALGWWSIRGLFCTPILIYANARSLWHKSDLSRVAVAGLTLCALFPSLYVFHLIFVTLWATR